MYPVRRRGLMRGYRYFVAGRYLVYYSVNSLEIRITAIIPGVMGRPEAPPRGPAPCWPLVFLVRFVLNGMIGLEMDRDASLMRLDHEKKQMGSTCFSSPERPTSRQPGWVGLPRTALRLPARRLRCPMGLLLRLGTSQACLALHSRMKSARPRH